MSPTHGHSTPDQHAADKPAARRGLSNRLVRLGLVLTGAILFLGSAVWYFTAPTQTPADQLAEALKLLDAAEHTAAREAAKALEEIAYSDPDFPGGVEFVLGVAAFHLAEAGSAEGEEPVDAPQQYTVASTYLQEADRRGVIDARRPQWSYVLGKSLHALQDLSGARPLLEEAVATYPPQRAVAARLLAELYFDPEERTTERLSRALELFDLVGKETSDADADRDATLVLRGEILIAMGRFREAEALAEQLLQTQADHPGAIVLQAQVSIGEKRYEDAIKRLAPLLREKKTEEKHARQALFLTGWAADQHATALAATADAIPRTTKTTSDEATYRQIAQDHYQKTIDKFAETPEALAATVYVARLQLAAGAHEKALQSYGAALRAVQDADDFHNRWLTAEQFRVQVLAAWNAWNQAGRYADAIALAELMTPLYPRDQAYDLAARTRQRWAEGVERELARSTATVQTQRAPELRRLWRDSGAAFARLSLTRQSSADYHEMLWTSADHAYRGHDYETALAQLNEYLRNPPEAMQPLALLRRGQVQLDRDRLTEAANDLAEVVRTNPTSPAAFSAQYLLGVCKLEQNDAVGAEAAWRKILLSNQLTPAASEWRDALLAVGKLQADLAGYEQRKTLRRAASAEEVAAAWTHLQELAGASTKLLEEYVARYPQSPQFTEAQYHLGRALQLQADWQQHQFDHAETDNARQQARKLRDQFLNRALSQFEPLRERLAALGKEDKLDAPGRTLLANAWFDLPATYFNLGRYDDAITAYSAAANQFPQDVRVLTAYLQMAQAYALSGRPVEARSMLEQAQVILDQKQIPDAAFSAPTTSLTRTEWSDWLDRARQVQR